MTKKEILLYFTAGKKITHPELICEWVQNRGGQVLVSNGDSIPARRFWNWHKSDSYKTGWKVWE